MRKALVVAATLASLGAVAVAGPAEARGRFGPGIAFGLAAGAIAAGVAANSYYGPYGYGYGPRYYSYGPAYYGPGPYAYYDRPYYRHRHWHRW